MNTKTLLFGALMAASSGLVYANQITFETFDVYDPTGTTLLAIDIDALDWAQNGSAMTEAFLAPGDDFIIRYQSYIQGYNPIDGTTDAGAVGLVRPFSNGGYEITAAAEFHMTVETGGAVLGPSSFNTVLNSGTFSIFYDSAVYSNTRAVPTSGLGFDDGLEVMRLSVQGYDPIDGTGLSTFNLSTLGSGVGSTTIHFAMTQPSDFINSTVFPTFTTLTEMQFDATLNRPANDSNTTGFFFNDGGDVNYAERTVTTVPDGQIGDVVFKSDGASRFGEPTTIDEPAPLALMLGGLGLLGSLTVRNRVKKTKETV
jgi:hypothetical protein